MNLPRSLRAAAYAGATFGLALAAHASSHREAPLITATPKVDASDFYAFNSYEAGRSNYVTLVACYLPLQDAYGGPNYFSLDPQAVYEVHVDNNGDAVEDLTFQFRFQNLYKDIALPIGPAGNQRTNAIPLINAGVIAAGDTAALNLVENYTLTLVRGPRRTGMSNAVTHAGGATFTKPVDYIGLKSIPDYAAYADSHLYEINLPGTAEKGRVFVGQRKDPFVVNLGETFDLINISTSPLGPENANKDSLAYKNVTALVLELPVSFVTAPGRSIIGAWTTASLPDGQGGLRQVSRLGMPLVNEVVIGLKDKDKFNASEPKDDLANFADYVTHPTLPALIELLYSAAGAKAPDVPRTDLVAAFVTGLDGLNKDGGVGEMIRLNTAIPAKPAAQQSRLAALAGDVAGFPNGRRPGDDVVDIELRVAMGALVPGAPNQNVPFTDGAFLDASFFAEQFPYLRLPVKGSPNDPTVNVLLKSAAAVHGPYQNAAGVSWNQAAKQLTADQPAAGQGFYRLESDGPAKFNGIATEGGNVKLGLAE
jgi:hypothetical protein